MAATIMQKKKQIEEKLNEILSISHKKLELDFEFNLLLAAVLSYRHESVLKPFPSTFTSDKNDKNYEDLANTLLSMPPISKWKSQFAKFNQNQMSLTHWLTMDKNYSLKLRLDMTQDDLKSIINYTIDIPKAQYIFELTHTEEKNRKFDELKITHGSMLAFHGSKFDNFYSILNCGLLSHLNKTSVFGEGTYLSKEPSVSLHYSPSIKTWNKSQMGQRMSGLLVCEIINDLTNVKQGEHVNNSKTIPDKYFIVQNNEHVRVRFILVYAEKQSVTHTQSNSNRLRHMLVENKFLLMLCSYAFMLIFVGLMNSRTFHKYIKFGYKKLSSLLLGEATSGSYE